MADDAGHTPMHVPPAPQPAHVPDALVYDYDKYTDPALLADPHARLADLARNAPPIFWTPRRGGHWMFVSHEAVFEGSRDFETFSNELVPRAAVEAAKAAMPAGMHIPELAPITADPPLHGIYRMPLNPAFSPKRINTLKDEVRELARELIGKIAPDGHCEFMGAVAEPLPVQIFLKLLGLPLDHQGEYRAFVKDSATAGSSDPQVSIRNFQKVAAMMRPVVAERQENRKDDLISLLWDVKLEGRATKMEDLEDYGVMLFLAGLDTVMNGIGLGVRHLAADPELQAKLRADPSLMGDATEELLRRYTFTIPHRTVAKDTVFQGVEFRKGDIVNLVMGSADLDPLRFEDPERFDLDREGVHIAFGVGPHRCVGSHLARIELQILYEELLAGLPPFRIDPDRPPRYHGGHVIGPDSLHLLWDV